LRETERQVRMVITVSETAAEKIREILAKQKNPESTMLRIAFGGYG